MASAANDFARGFREQLARILATPDFANFPRSAAFLRYVVEQTLAGRATDLKETVIGVEVFGREAGYDAKSDSIVRTQARRVREKLSEYYANGGAADRVIIEIPKGAYVPEFRAAQMSAVAPAPLPQRGRKLVLLAILAAVAAAGALLVLRQKTVPQFATIGVLPVSDLDPQHRYAALADGLTEDLERSFSRLPGVRVHAHPVGLSAEQRADYPEIARRLGVDMLLDARVTLEGGAPELRVSLVRGADRVILWTEKYPVSAGVGAAERQIQEAVARELHVELPGSLAHAENPQAHDLYFAGRALWATRDPSKTEQAIELYQQALKIDPDYALAYMGIADAYALLAGNGLMDSRVAIEKGVPAVKRALELDPGLAEAHAAYGLLYLAEHDFKNAGEEYQKAIDLNPSYDRAYVRAGTLKFMLGDFPAAEKLIRESERLNPYAMSLPMIRAELYYYWRRFPDSIELANVVLGADPGNVTAFQVLVRNYLQLNQPLRSVEAARAAVAARPEWLFLKAELASSLYRAGEKQEAGAIIRRLVQAKMPDEIDPLVVALMYARIGDRDATLKYLELAQTDSSVDLPSIRFEPALDFVRTDPRYLAVAQKATPR